MQLYICVESIVDDGHHANAWTVCVVRVILTADSRIKRLCVLLTASSNHHCLTHLYRRRCLKAFQRNDRRNLILQFTDFVTFLSYQYSILNEVAVCHVEGVEK